VSDTCPNPRCVNGEVSGGERGLLLCPDCRGRRERAVGTLGRHAGDLIEAQAVARSEPERLAFARLLAGTLDAIELLNGSDA
jgi:hypothetical protein